MVKALSSSLKLEPFALTFFGSRRCTCAYFRGFVFVCLIQTAWTKLNSMIKKKIIDRKIFFNLQSHPTFHSVERLANLKRGRECFVCLSILLLVYAASRCQLILANSHVVTHAAQPYLQNVIQVQHKHFRYEYE